MADEPNWVFPSFHDCMGQKFRTFGRRVKPSRANGRIVLAATVDSKD
jgi:hypothetical protein